MQPIGPLRPRHNNPRLRGGLATRGTGSPARKSVRRAPLPMISGTPDRQDTCSMPPKNPYRIRCFVPDFDAGSPQIARRSERLAAGATMRPGSAYRPAARERIDIPFPRACGLGPRSTCSCVAATGVRARRPRILALPRRCWRWDCGHRGRRRRRLQAPLSGRECHLMPNRCSIAPRDDGPRRFGKDVGKAFQIPLWVAGGDARDPPCHGPRSGPAARQAVFRLPQGAHPQGVGVFLRPLDPGLGAIDPQPQPVFLPCRHLTAPQHPPCPPL